MLEQEVRCAVCLETLSDPQSRLRWEQLRSSKGWAAPGKRGTATLRRHGAPADRGISLIFLDGTSLDLCAETDLWRDRLVREMRALQGSARRA